MSRLLLRLVLITALAPVSVALAQVPATPGASGTEEQSDRVTRPGKGPQIPFDESRWEFWWYYNKEEHIGLRPALLATAPGAADMDVPFQAVTTDDRKSSIMPYLVFALKDSDPEVQIAALHALAKTQETSARSYLFPAVRDSNPPVRRQAILALGVWGNSQALERLESILKDDKAALQERMYAALAIGMVGGPSSAEALKELVMPARFGRSELQVQSGLAYALGLVGGPDAAVLIRTLLDSAEVRDYVVRSYLVLSLGKCSDPTDAERLIQALSHKETQVRRSAAIALGALLRKTGHEKACAALVQATKGDPDVMVKNFAYISLGYVGGAQAGSRLTADLEQTTKAYRPFIAVALGLLGNPENVPPLMKAFAEESDNSYRAALAISLGLHRDGRASPVLREAFASGKEPVLRGHIAVALGMIGDVESIDALTGSIDGATDVEMIANVATALGLLGARDTTRKLAEGIPLQKNEFVRQSLLYGLGLIGDRKAIPALSTAVKLPGEVAYVRAYAVTALGLLGETQEIRAIARVSRDSNYTIVSDFLNEVFRVL